MSIKRELIRDIDSGETQDWLDALEHVLKTQGIERANFLLQRLSARMTKTGASLPYTITTPYRNTIPSSQEAMMPGDLFMERRIRSLIRWNALALVVRANRREGELGGHISSFAMRSPAMSAAGAQALEPETVETEMESGVMATAAKRERAAWVLQPGHGSGLRWSPR